MVNTAPYGGAPGATRDPFGVLEGGGKSISWANSDQWGNQTSVPPGTYHDIEITEDPEVRQDTHFADDPGGKFKKGELKFYADGNPVESFIVTGRVISPTIQPEDENDDLVRRDYFRGQKKRALQDAFKAINVRPGDGFGHGTVLRITLIGFKPTQNGAPQKLYDVQFLKYVPRASAAFGSLEQGQPPQQQAGQQAGQYVTPTQWAASAPLAPQAAPQSQYAPPAPQQQYAPPAQPAAAPAQPQYAPPAAPPQQPVQQVPAGVPAVQAAGYVEVPQQAPQQAAPAAPAVPAGGAPAVLQQHVDKVTMAIGVGIDRAGAIQAVADEVAPGNAEFRAALDNVIPI